MAPLTRNPHVVQDVVEGTTMLCHTASVEFFKLNPTGATIWGACQGRSVDQITDELQRLYPATDRRTLRAEVQSFVDVLKAADLVSEGDTSAPTAEARSAG